MPVTATVPPDTTPAEEAALVAAVAAAAEVDRDDVTVRTARDVELHVVAHRMTRFA